MHKPVGLINASPQSTHAQASLAETLTVMMAVLVPEACRALRLPGKSVDETGVLANSEAVEVLTGTLTALVGAVQDKLADE